MLRSAVIGAVTFGLTAAVAGYVWTAFEFPFAIFVPAFLGWFVVVRRAYPVRKAWLAAAVGGATFTALFMLGMFLAISDGSPLAVTGWLAAVLAAVVAGALTGEVIGGNRGALPVAALSAAGMLVATVAASVMRDLAPVATQVPGIAQYGYFALAQGVVGMLVGAAVGAGVWLVASRSGETPFAGRPSTSA